MNKGYFVKIDRTFPEHWLYNCKPFDYAHAWIDLIMLADIQDHKKPYKGTVKLYKRGAVNISILKLSERWGWSRKKTRHFLTLLENDGMVLVKATTKDTTITLVNYGTYQDKGTTKGTTKEQLGYQQRNSWGNTPKDNKDIKEWKEEEEILPPGAVRLPDGSVDYENVPSNWDW